jgi:hypothetical protein
MVAGLLAGQSAADQDLDELAGAARRHRALLDGVEDAQRRVGSFVEDQEPDER